MKHPHFSSKNNPSHLGKALHEENMRAPNCFSLGPNGQLHEGMYLTLYEPNPNGSGIRPPHLKIGHRFILRNNNGNAGCMYRPMKERGLVRRAVLSIVTPIGGKPFEVLNRPRLSEKLSFQLVHINHGINGTTDIRIKEHVCNLGIWHGVAGTAKVICTSGDYSLVEFNEDGQVVYVMCPDGSVRSVVRREGFLSLQPLSVTDMAVIRMDTATGHLMQCDQTELGIKRRDGILFGTIKLLQLTAEHSEARGVILDFLRGQELSDRMRLEIRNTLTKLADPEALEFSDIAYSVVTSKQAKGLNKQRKARKAEQSARDRELRQLMRGNRGQVAKSASSSKQSAKRR